MKVFHGWNFEPHHCAVLSSKGTLLCSETAGMLCCVYQLQYLVLFGLVAVPLLPRSAVPLLSRSAVPLRPRSAVPLRPRSAVPLLPRSAVPLLPCVVPLLSRVPCHYVLAVPCRYFLPRAFLPICNWTIWTCRLSHVLFAVPLGGTYILLHRL
jgi:hypothetical protein